MKRTNFKLQHFSSDFNEELFPGGGGDPLPPSFDVTENYYLEKNKFLENATGNKVMERVNIRTGKAYVSQFVYGVNGNRLPFNLSLTYNPYFYDKTEIFDDLTTNGKSGFLPAKGWKFNYQQYLRKQYNYYYYYDQNFELHKFAPALGDSSIYYDSTGQTGLTLKEVLTNGSINSYEITDGKNTTLTFNAQGALVKITEKRGINAIDLTITYNENSTRITSITDGANRTFNFVYDEQGSILIKQGEINVIGTTINAEKRLHTVYYVKEDDNIYFDYASTDFIMPKCLIGIKNLISYDTTTITIDESTKKVSSLRNYKYGVANEDYLTTTLSFTYAAKRTNLCSYTKTTNDVIISNTNHYYFAQNGELIYTVTDDPTPEGGEQTLADRAIDFLEANTFATAKDFNHCIPKLQLDAIANLTFGSEESTNPSFAVNSIVQSNASEVVLAHKTYCLMTAKSVKTTNEALSGSVKVNINVDGTTVETLMVEEGNGIFKSTAFAIAAGEHNITATVINADTESIKVELSVYPYGGSENYEVININNRTGILNNPITVGNTTWYETKKCNITNGTQTVENIEFTYRDYILTLISYFKNNASFTAWYNDCKNAITGCTKDTLKYLFITNGAQKTLLEFNMAQLQKTIRGYTLNYALLPNENATYIQLNTKTVFGDEERDSYARIDSYLREYYTKDANNLITNLTYNSYGECTQQKVYPLGNSAMNILTTTGYNAKGEVASESSYKNLKTYTTRYTYNEDGDIVTVTTPNGQVVNYDYNLNKLNKMHTTLSSSSTALENKYSYENNNVTSLQSANGGTYGFDYNEFNEVINVKLNNASILSQQTYYNNDKSGYIEITYGNGYIDVGILINTGTLIEYVKWLTERKPNYIY